MGHRLLAKLTGYITSETYAGLKRKVFGMLDGGDLGQLHWHLAGHVDL